MLYRCHGHLRSARVEFDHVTKSESSVFPLVALRAKGNKKKPAG